MFAFNSIMIGEMQIINARRLYTSAVNTIQSSYYTVIDWDAAPTTDENYKYKVVQSMNDKIHEKFNDNWKLSVEKEPSTVPTREDVKVTLEYQVIVPIFNIVKTGTIEGYAR